MPVERLAATPCVAFCDDDSWWEDGALDLAVEILDHYPEVAALCGRVLLGADCREDPTCAEMARSPLPSAKLPGPALLGFIACAVVFRRDAYLQDGGYEARFFIGGEEALLTLDLAAAGWRIAYAPQLTVHHHPSPYRAMSRVRSSLSAMHYGWPGCACHWHGRSGKPCTSSGGRPA